MTRSDLIIAGSNFIFSHIKQNYSKYLNDKKKLLVIFRGINVDYFDPTTKFESDEKKLLTKWNIEKDKKIILSASSDTFSLDKNAQTNPNIDAPKYAKIAALIVIINPTANPAWAIIRK